MSRGGDLSGSGGGGGGSKEYFVDTKLVFRLKQFVGEQQERGSLVTEDIALNYLLDKYKEYVRKPQVSASQHRQYVLFVFVCSYLLQTCWHVLILIRGDDGMGSYYDPAQC